MRTLRLLFVAMLLSQPLARADIAVIVNASNPVSHMTNQQVADLYLGRARTFANGEYALVFDLGRDAPLREKFFTVLTNMSMQQVNAYWSRLMFTGQVLPPQSIPNDRAVLEIIRRNPSAIGYVKAEGLDASVRSVLTLKE
jgi:ABC-type phosphate transport system substrate-binding protein